MSRLRQRSSSWLLESPLEDRGALYIQPCSQYFFFLPLNSIHYKDSRFRTVSTHHRRLWFDVTQLLIA